MSRENVIKFCKQTENDEALQARVGAILKAPNDLQEEAAQIAALGEEAGLPFTADEYIAELTKMSDEELDNVAGGTEAERADFRALLKKKGYWNVGISQNCILHSIGIVCCQWHESIWPWFDQPPDFWDEKGKRYTYKDIKEAVSKLPDYKDL